MSLPFRHMISVFAGRSQQMSIRVRPVCALVLALIAVAAILPGDARAEGILDQDWVLNPAQSHVYMQTEKLDAVIERHQFKTVEGHVSKDGDAGVKIDLGTLDTGIDLRNVRMRFVLFETFKYPYAEITTRLDKSKLQFLSAARAPVKGFPLTLNVNMHGLVKEIKTEVWITRVNDSTVSVSTVSPIVVSAETFGFTKNIAKLADAMGGIRIVPSASITFDLVFATGELKSQIEAANQQREKAQVQEKSQAITSEGCETRLSVLSETGAIYFKTGSAELDQESEPLLNSGADIANRCPSVKFDVEGHTDNVGSKRSNQKLSEDRAKSVVDYLTAKGVAASRIHSMGYGETRPVVPNNSGTNRAKNRRIEFKVIKN
jgi:OOP family OmpA-OmpF porin